MIPSLNANLNLLTEKELFLLLLFSILRIFVAIAKCFINIHIFLFKISKFNIHKITYHIKIK